MIENDKDYIEVLKKEWDSLLIIGCKDQDLEMYNPKFVRTFLFEKLCFYQLFEAFQSEM